MLLFMPQVTMELLLAILLLVCVDGMVSLGCLCGKAGRFEVNMALCDGSGHSSGCVVNGYGCLLNYFDHITVKTTTVSVTHSQGNQGRGTPAAHHQRERDWKEVKADQSKLYHLHCQQK